MTIDELNALTTLTAADEVPVWDKEASGEPTKKITAQNMAASVKSLASLPNTTEMNAAIAQSTANFGKRTVIGNRQGVGDITLSESIQNFRYVYLLVGYYASGQPTYGSVIMPVDGLPVGDKSNNNFKVITEDNGTLGAATVRFASNTVLKVTSITGSATWYINVSGIK